MIPICLTHSVKLVRITTPTKKPFRKKTTMAKAKAKAKAKTKKVAAPAAELDISAIEQAVDAKLVAEARKAWIALQGGKEADKRSKWLKIGEVYAKGQAACNGDTKALNAWSKKNKLDSVDNSSRGAAAWFFDNNETIMQIEQSVKQQLAAAAEHNKTASKKDQIDLSELAKADPAKQNSPKHLRGKVGKCLTLLDKETVEELDAKPLLEDFLKAQRTAEKAKAEKEAKAQAERMKPFTNIEAGGFSMEMADQVQRFSTVEQLDNLSRQLKHAIDERRAQLAEVKETEAA